MKLKELFDKVEWKDLKAAICKEYPEQKKSLKGYEMAFNEIRGLKPKAKKTGEDWCISIEECEDWYDKSKYIHVSGKCEKASLKEKMDKDQSWSLEFTDWREWLDMDVRIDTMIGGKVLNHVDMLAHIIYEMTWMGFTNKKVNAERRKIDYRVKQIDKWKKEGTLEKHTFTLEQVKERINKKIAKMKKKQID